MKTMVRCFDGRSLLRVELVGSVTPNCRGVETILFGSGVAPDGDGAGVKPAGETNIGSSMYGRGLLLSAVEGGRLARLPLAGTVGKSSSPPSIRTDIASSSSVLRVSNKEPRGPPS